MLVEIYFTYALITLVIAMIIDFKLFMPALTRVSELSPDSVAARFPRLTNLVLVLTVWLLAPFYFKMAFLSKLESELFISTLSKSLS